MESQTKQCQNCQKDFTIEPDDFSFYEKIKVPPPTWCPECRLIRRFSFQNTWNICWRNCEKCGKKTLSVYSPSSSTKIYCQPCWWADDWDGTEYGMDYDPDRPFLVQMKELLEKTPYSALTSLYTSNKNCDYANALAWSKNCLLVFWADFCENVYNSSLLMSLKNSVDCLRGYHSELCYESIGINRDYRVFFSEECDDCMDVWFSRNCYNCTNCIGCVNLRGASNCIFNVKYSKEEYALRLEEMKLDSWESLKQLKEKTKEFWMSSPYRESHAHSLNLNSSGDYVYESKNSKEMYIATGAEDCKFCQFITVKPAKECRDYSGWGNNANQMYEAVTIGENANSVYFSVECWPDVLNLQYCFWNIAGKNNLGCANLKKKQYCILNKQYTKEKFEELKKIIISDMKTNPYTDHQGRKFFYGEFFSPELSRFSYNRSNAMRFFPKTKEQAVTEGYSWEEEQVIENDISMKNSSLPDSINQTVDSILEEVIQCAACDRGYKIAKLELDLLRTMNLPLPHECPKCRENKRFSRLNKPKFYDRNCAKCGKGMRTAYAPERSEIIYCEKCYQREFL